MNQEELSELLVVGAKIKIGKNYSEYVFRRLKEGDIIELIEGIFDNEFVSNVRCPSIWNKKTQRFESIYHLFGNYFELFMDCEILNNNKNKMETTDKKTITWADLKEAANKMNEEQLNTPVYIAQDDEYWVKINEITLVEEDIYVNTDDNDDAGTIKDLKELHDDEFVLENYKLMAKKDTPFLSIINEYEFNS